MEPIFKRSGSIKCLEILFFEDAEVQKNKGGQTSCAASGPLSVVYLKEYRRFFLRLNDWFYPLMRRLPVIGMDKTDGSSSRLYCLPGRNGFHYILRINCYGSDGGLENFETILQECSQFSWKGEAHHGRLERSPDDNVFRRPKKDTGLMDIIGQHLKQGAHTLKSKVKTLQTGTKNLTSRKKMLDLKTIKNKHFRKNAKSTFKKDYFLFHEKVSQEFLNMRRLNLNMTLPKAFQELLETPESQVPALYFPKEDVSSIFYSVS